MFKKFRESTYTKAALMILVCGGLLIVFSHLVTKGRFSIGFDNINKTLQDGNGTQTAFAFNFKIFKDSDIKVAIKKKEKTSFPI